MSTSDLLSRMYQPPWKVLNAQQQTLTQKLLTTLGSPTSATTARNAFSCNGSAQTSTSCSDPYLHRVYWLLTNADGLCVIGINGTVLQFAASPNAVPEQLRFCSYQAIKKRWLSLRELGVVDVNNLSIQPVDFYAHRATPHLWCSCDD